MNKKLFVSASALLTLLSWLFQYIFISNPTAFLVATSVELCVFGLLLCLILIFLKDTFYSIVLIGFLPFIFAQGFDPNHIPFALYIAIGLALVGLVIYIIRNKPKLKLGAYFYGLVAFGASLILGGIFNKDNGQLIWQIIFCFMISFAFIVFYVFLVSTNKSHDFDDLAFYMNVFAIMLMAQATIYYLSLENFFMFFYKSLELGWGVGNNFSLIMLLLGPFALYKGIFGKRKYDFLYIFLKLAETFYILSAYSRGCLFIDVMSMGIILLVAMIKKKKEWWKIGLPIGVTLVAGISILLIIGKEHLTDVSIFTNIKEKLFDELRFDSLNGRLAIYTSFIKKSFDHPIFGHGVLYPLVYTVDAGEGVYQWGHCTLVHSLFTTGLFGLVAVLFHFVEKYYSCLKNISPEKFILLLSFLLSGAYGMMDISYFYPNYMVLLVMIFVLADNSVSKLIIRRNKV